MLMSLLIVWSGLKFTVCNRPLDNIHVFVALHQPMYLIQ